jgi:hypothetical protein
MPLADSDRRDAAERLVNYFARVAAVVVLGSCGALIAVVAGASSQTVDLVAIGSALVVGELVELRPPDRSPLPVSFAIVIVLLRAATPKEFVVIVVSAAFVGALLCSGELNIPSRALAGAEWLAAGLGAGAIYRVTTNAFSTADARVAVLGALAAAALTEVVVADLIVFVRERRVTSLRQRGADLALVTSGMLMAVGYGGIAGQGRLGLWGPLLFSIPLVAAWYSFELLGRTERTFYQTVRALGVAPELGGLVRPGHVERVADLAVAIGNELRIGDSELADLATASWLHHLGAVSLDEPGPEHQLDGSEVARAGAEMLRSSNALASAGDIIAAEPSLHRSPNAGPQHPAEAMMGQILKVASAYDELTEGDDSHASWAVEALFTGPAYVYDGRVLSALERVLAHHGVLHPGTSH